jgi:lipopolysaccharide cholinephosphotransferase
MKEMTKEEFRTALLDTMSAVDLFCTEHHIHYSVADGTLLGAVRHNGFIPWDDDIDIYMLREDYNRFVSLFPKKYKEQYTMHCLENNPEWHKLFAKVCDDRTLMQNELRSVEQYGVNIDVFPVDEVPDNQKEWKRFMRKVMVLYSIINNKSRKISKKRSFSNNIGIALLDIVLFPFSRKFLFKCANRFIQKNNGKGFKSCYEVSFGLDLKHPFDRDLFNDIRKWEFEDRLYYGFTNASIFLEKSYGSDFMKLPPLEKRVHHSEKAYWK